MTSVLRTIASCFPAVLLALIYVGDSYRHPHITTPVFFGIMILWALAVRFCRPKSTEGEGRPDKSATNSIWETGAGAWWIRAAAAAAGGLLWVLLSDRTYQGMLLYPKLEGSAAYPVWIAVGLLGALMVRPLKARYAVFVLALAGILVRACGLWQWEINPARRDMLALVISALDTFLSGENPYAFHQMQVGSQVPLTYPPGLWLAHLPAHLLDLDIRWTGILADAAVAVLVVTASAKRGISTVGPVFLGAAVYLFLPDTHWNGIYAEPNFDWAVLAMLCAAALSEKPLATGLIMGFALATRPFNLVLLPFLLIWLVRTKGFFTAWRAAIAAGLVAAAFYLPFVMRDPDAFYTGTVRWLLEYGQVHHRWFFGMLGCSGFLYKAGRADLLTWFQLGSVGLVFLVALWRLRTTAGLLVSMGLAYAFFVAFNSIIWMSFWVGVCIILLFGTGALGAVRQKVPPSSSRSAPRGAVLWVQIAASILILCAGGLLVHRLVVHFSTEGREEVVQILKEKTASGETVLDLTGHRVAFLKVPLILGRRDLKPGVTLAVDPFTAALPQKRDLSKTLGKRIWVASRYGQFDDVSRVYTGDTGGPYELVSDENVGEYRLVVLELPKIGPLERLQDHPERLVVSKEEGENERFAVWNSKHWRFAKGKGWEWLGTRTERIGRVSRKLLWAHPHEVPFNVKATFEEPCRWVRVYGGLKDRAAQWGRAEVSIAVKDSSGEIGSVGFENRPGIQGEIFQVSPPANELTFVVKTENTARRQFLMDAVCIP